jgi:hypothetical protein
MRKRREPSLVSIRSRRPHIARSQITLYGRGLLTARIVWVIAVVLVVGTYIAAVPVAYTEYQKTYPSYTLAALAADFVFTLGNWAIGALIFWKRSGDGLGLLFSFVLVTLGALNIVNVSERTPAALGLLGTFITFFGWVSLFLAFSIFPDGRLVPRWIRWPMIVWVLYIGLLQFLPEDSSFHPEAWPPLLSVPLSVPLAVSFLGILVFAQVYRYWRVSGPVERQQTKWVVFGLATALAGSVLVTMTPVVYSPLLRAGVPVGLYALVEWTVTNTLFFLIPLSMGVAILRYRLWDIDLIINRTLVYGSLTFLLALVYFGSVAATEAIFRNLTGQEEQPQLAIVVSTLVIAALFNPLRRRIQSFIDRLFFRSKYDAAKTLETFSAKLRDETDLDALRDDLVGAVRETMQPAHVSLWLHPDPALKEKKQRADIRESGHDE